MQDLLQSCSRGGRGQVEDMRYVIRRAEACAQVWEEEEEDLFAFNDEGLLDCCLYFIFLDGIQKKCERPESTGSKIMFSLSSVILF